MFNGLNISFFFYKKNITYVGALFTYRLKSYSSHGDFIFKFWVDYHLNPLANIKSIWVILGNLFSQWDLLIQWLNMMRSTPKLLIVLACVWLNVRLRYCHCHQSLTPSLWSWLCKFFFPPQAYLMRCSFPYSSMSFFTTIFKVFIGPLSSSSLNLSHFFFLLRLPLIVCPCASSSENM